MIVFTNDRNFSLSIMIFTFLIYNFYIFKGARRPYIVLKTLNDKLCFLCGPECINGNTSNISPLKILLILSLTDTFYQGKELPSFS